MKGPVQTWPIHDSQREQLNKIKGAGLFEECVNDIKNTMITEITDTQFISDEMPVDDDEFNDAVHYATRTIEDYFQKSEELKKKEV